MFTDSELGELCGSLNIIVEWLRATMRRHLDPKNTDELSLKSEQDIGDMIEAYFGTLFHHLFRLSDHPTQPLNTSVVNQDESRRKMARLKATFRLTDASFEAAPVQNHLKHLRELFSSSLKGPQINDHQSTANEVWAGGHVWLERRLATGFRLLFLEGEQWNYPRACWSISRVVHDWPHTFTRTILSEFRTKYVNHELGGVPKTSQVCTALCAFSNPSEKEHFEAASGLSEGEYIYLWAGDDPSLSDFNNSDLVWFKDPGEMREDELFKRDVLPKEPARAEGLASEVKARWSILRDEWREGLTSRDDKLDKTLMMRFAYERNLLRDIYKKLEQKDLSGRLPNTHWLKRNTDLLRLILRKESYSLRDTFWAVQSVMFYDWKYWYVFPFNYEGSPSGGLALSSANPLTKRQISQVATIINELFRVFAETEEWARNRLRQRKEINLQRAAERVHAEWVRRGKVGKEIINHKILFQNLSRLVLDVTFADSLKRLQGSDPLTPQFKFLYETWEKQVSNIDYSVVNYWGALDRDRIFAEWLSPSLGEGAKKRWDKVWSIYNQITQHARDKLAYYTFNDFLFDKAPRKAILEWRGHNWQLVPRGQDNPKDWINEPPSITPDVASILFKDLKFDYDIEGASVEHYIKDNVETYIKTIEQRVDQLREFIVEHAESYSKKLADFIVTNEWTELGLYKGDLSSLRNVLQRLRDDAGDLRYEANNDDRLNGHISQKRLAAEYLVRLAIYLNVQMNTIEEGSKEGLFLGHYRCAFLSWALFEHYHPDRFRASPSGDHGDSPSATWYFYSIPVHIPLVDKDEASRTSILSLGTTLPLTNDELKGWSEIGKEIVLPALMIDLSKEVREREFERLRAGMAVGLYHQLGQVLASARARTDILISEGEGLSELVEHLKSIDGIDQGEFDTYKEEKLQAWKQNIKQVRARLDRGQMFRDFAYAQLTGTISNETSATALHVAKAAFEIAKEYLLNLDPSQSVSLEFDPSLEAIKISEAAYGFILQELVANAYRITSQLPNPKIWISVVQEDGESFLEVRNSISEEIHRRLKKTPLNFKDAPGPDRQSGRGLFGIYCIFRARKIRNAPKYQLTETELAFRVPVIEF